MPEKRELKVSLAGMLKVSQPPNPPKSTPEPGTRRIYSTLDQLPDFSLSTISQLYSLVLKPFERFHGVLIHGPLDPDECEADEAQSDAMWGRKVVLTTNETIQMRFSPPTMLNGESSGQGVVTIALRIARTGRAEVRTCVMWPPELNLPPNMPNPLIRSPGVSSARGLHLLLISFFKQHEPELGASNERATCASWTTDPSGYGSVRSTTFSLTHLAPKKFKNFNHSNDSLGVCAGTSQLVLAGEIANVELPDVARRASEPINIKDYKLLLNGANEGIFRSDQETGRAAVAAASTISELISGDGIIAMLSNPAFDGALPVALSSPTGLGLLIVMSVRIAMNAPFYGLNPGSVADSNASSEVKALFEAAMEPMPLVQPNQWAIDLAIRMATGNARKTPDPKNANANRVLCDDQLVFWQRAGQATITALFGAGTSTDTVLPNRFGVPWRFHDPLICAKDVGVAGNVATDKDGGVVYEPHPPVDEARLQLASTHTRRTTLIKLLIDTENYLRTGEYRGKQLAKPNDQAKATKDMFANQLSLNEFVLPSFLKGLKETGKVDMNAHNEAKDRLYRLYNMSAMSLATLDLSEALSVGPVVSFKHRIGSFLVADSQKTLCCDCDAAVHVLQGCLLNYAYGQCINCKAKRCLRCSSQYGLSMLTDKTKKVWGCKCRRCGTEPPRAHSEKTIDPVTGKETVTLRLEPMNESTTQEPSTPTTPSPTKKQDASTGHTRRNNKKK